MNITLIISSLDSGGAERVLTGMANWWSKHGHRITIITLSDHVAFYQLDSNISHVKLGLLASSKNTLQAVQGLFNRLRILRTEIKKSKPEVVISFLDKTNILTLLACFGLNYKIIVSERTNPLHLTISSFWSFLRKITYNNAAGLVVQTRSVVGWSETQVDLEKIFVIPNALDAERISQIQESSLTLVELPWKNRVITMGRLSHEKGHDLLLKACAKSFSEFPDWGLEIIGDGIDKERLMFLAEDLKIAHRVKFYGQIKAPFGLIKGADIFALPSRVEGFPNALLEAMALGKAVVSFDCPSGPSELIKDGENGFLIHPEDVDAFSFALNELIMSPCLRERLGSTAQNVQSIFSEENIMQLWDEVITS